MRGELNIDDAALPCGAICGLKALTCGVRGVKVLSKGLILAGLAVSLTGEVSPEVDSCKSVSAAVRSVVQSETPEAER